MERRDTGFSQDVGKCPHMFFTFVQFVCFAQRTLVVVAVALVVAVAFVVVVIAMVVVVAFVVVVIALVVATGLFSIGY